MPAVTYDRSAVKPKAEALYRDIIRPQLSLADKGKYLYIHTGAGQWVMDADDLTAARKARELWGTGQPVFVMRIGHRAATSFRIGLDTELVEW